MPRRSKEVRLCYVHRQQCGQRPEEIDVALDETTPKSAGLLYNRARFEARQGNDEAALDELRSAFEKRPDREQELREAAANDPDLKGLTP